MQYQTEILRFKEGARSRHPSPEATVAAAQANVLEAGSQIAVVVDLTPPLPYRSREIRTLVVKAYWNSSGSIVARLRRALAAANRHLISFNQQAPAGSKCSGSLTCAVFAEDELFLGQVGAAYAYVTHQPDPDNPLGGRGAFEIFPKRDRLLIPLGGTVPPIIHVGYTVMRPGSVACLATTQVAEAQAREAWEQVLMQPKAPLITSQLSREFSSRDISGSVILIRAQAEVPKTAPWIQPGSPHRGKPQRTGSRTTTVPKTTTEAPGTAVVPGTVEAPRVQAALSEQAASLSPLSESRHKPAELTSTERAAEQAPARGPRPAPPASAVPSRGTPPSPPSTTTGKEAEETEPAAPRRARVAVPRIRLSLPPFREWLQSAANGWRARREQRKHKGSERATTVERARLRQALRTLLPGKVETKRQQAPRTPPAERSPVVAGITLGIALIVVLVTIAERFYWGGAGRADELMTEVHTLRESALSSQDRNDWQALYEKALRVVRLDPENAEAESYAEEARQVLDAQENTSLLNLTQLLDLATSPVPRRVLVAGGWVYILNSATDVAVALPLQPDGLSLSTDSPTSILKRGQAYQENQVAELVDFAWIEPNSSYPDGAVLIYGDGGFLYIYEPTLGPGSIAVQRIEGSLSPGAVTAMKTFGERFYLVNRQLNQISLYEPINGIYKSPRDYFAEGMVPDLYQIQDMGIDGRVYLLMGNGELRTYFSGTQDLSFNVRGIPEGTFEPRVMVVDPDDESGYVYLADPERERILMLDKQGNFVHQYRFPKGEVKRVEALAVSTDPRILYLIADNYLYSAPLPLPAAE